MSAAVPAYRVRRSRDRRPLRIVGPIVLALLYGVPMVWLILTSFKNNIDVFKKPVTIFFVPTLESYTSLFNRDLGNAIGNSFIIAIAVAIATLALAIPAAYALSRGGRKIITIGTAILVVMQMIPHTSMVIPLYKVLSSWHLLNTLQGVIIADIGAFLPFAMIILTPFMHGVAIEIEEAAAVDGANRLKIVLRIVLPLVANGVITVGLLLFVMGWGEFLFAINFLSDPNMYPLSALLSQQVGAYGINWSGLMALAVLASIPIAVLSIFGQRWLRNGLSIGAVK